MTTKNLLLDALPRDVYGRIGPHLKQVSLPRGEVLHRPGDEIRHIYFPVNCLLSITITTREGGTAEVGAVGSRELVGVNAFMGGRETTQTQYVVRVQGEAVRAEARPLRAEFDRSKEFRDVMLRFTQAMIAYISQNAACNRLHQMQQRLARWLLECRDRLETDELRLTQEFIAQMLERITIGCTGRGPPTRWRACLS